jgi:hypothetical protein
MPNAVAPPEFTTYYATAQVTGPSGGGPSGSNKAMLSLLNPSGSGKVVRLYLVEYFPISSSGTDVYIDMQLRAITAHSGGSSLTPIKRDSADAAASAEVRSEPTSLTGGGTSDLLQQLVIQSNAPSMAEAARFKLGDMFGSKPIILHPAEGLVVHQVTSNGGDFCPGLVWTET